MEKYSREYEIGMLKDSEGLFTHAVGLRLYYIRDLCQSNGDLSTANVLLEQIRTAVSVLLERMKNENIPIGGRVTKEAVSDFLNYLVSVRKIGLSSTEELIKKYSELTSNTPNQNK